ncbi:NADP-dependent malic enzyme [Thraustotheca clavata]|uniref:Malic enzyme n=1 Tax=Thraustotheca clavata TaxID=74557 RepID=A0A1W0A5S7_9STRA|nr:NADP-dependent malic enzyme [Thraustotheca clavata]
MAPAQNSTGFNVMHTPSLNKGLEFTAEEREANNLRGLVPSAIWSPELHLQHAMAQLRSKATPIEKYIFMQSMQDRNEQLYYRMLAAHTHELMPIVYTPTVGQACTDFSHIYRQTPRGVYISINDLGHVREILDNWPEQDIRAIVFTDGERILGLGDLGINGMGIPIGKLALYTACAGVHPKYCLPVTLDVGTNTQSILDDPFYMGLRQRRDRTEAYDQLVDEFMTEAKAKYGPQVLLQFEDFGNTNAFRLLHKYQPTHCTFNDDIQGTASVVLGGLFAAEQITQKSLSEHKFVFMGAGEAGTGIADLIAMAITKEDPEKSIEDARKQIYLVDSKGLVIAERKEGLQHHKLNYAHDVPAASTLIETIERVQPSVLIGVCTIAKTFNQQVCELMASINERPVIFALSNPTSKAECTAEEAYTWTKGKCVFASGSPFDPVTLGDEVFVPGQGNNAYVFPGIGLGVVAGGLTRVDDTIMLVAARTLADHVTDDDLKTGSVYPPLSKIRDVSLKIAAAVAEYGFEQGYATIEKPESWTELCQAAMYSP